MNWPQDADGDVFRRLEASGFDFSKKYWIDFQIDFDAWPPPVEAIEVLKVAYKSINLHPPEDGLDGYIELSLFEYVMYKFVTGAQDEISKLVERYGGSCASWGVLQD